MLRKDPVAGEEEDCEESKEECEEVDAKRHTEKEKGKGREVIEEREEPRKSRLTCIAFRHLPRRSFVWDPERNQNVQVAI
jgi:hypothetical protein